MKWSLKEKWDLESLAEICFNCEGLEYFISWNTISNILNYIYGKGRTSESVRKKYSRSNKLGRNRKSFLSPRENCSLWDIREIGFLIYLSRIHNNRKFLKWGIISQAMFDLTGIYRSPNLCSKKFYMECFNRKIYANRKY